MSTTWIVYEKPDGKLEAVKSEFHRIQMDDIESAGNKIVGYPAAKTAQAAIDYMEDIL